MNTDWFDSFEFFCAWKNFANFYINVDFPSINEEGKSASEIIFRGGNNSESNFSSRLRHCSRVMKTNRGTNLWRLAFPHATSLTFSFFRYRKNRGGIGRTFTARLVNHLSSTGRARKNVAVSRSAMRPRYGPPIAMRGGSFTTTALPLRDAPLFLLA